MKNVSIAVLATFAVVTGCAVQKQWIPIGGSRSDGTVKLAFEYSALQVPTVDDAAGAEQAKQRCAAWGYTGADRFGGITKTCSSRDVAGCSAYRVTSEYQCTGQPEKR